MACSSVSNKVFCERSNLEPECKILVPISRAANVCALVLFFLGYLGVPIDISSDELDTFPDSGVSSPMEEVFVGEMFLLIQAM